MNDQPRGSSQGTAPPDDPSPLFQPGNPRQDGRAASLIEAATLLRYQGRLASAMRLLDEARRKAGFAQDGRNLIRACLGQMACWTDRGLFNRAINAAHEADDAARQYELSEYSADIQASVIRIQRSRVFWWTQALLCVCIAVLGVLWNPLHLDLCLKGILTPWAFQLVALIQFGGISLTMAQMLGLFFLTPLDQRHLAHRFRFPHLLLTGWSLLACAAARFIMPDGAAVPYGLILAQTMLLFCPLALLLTVIPSIERWRGAWKPAAESAIAFFLFVAVLQTPSTNDLLVVTSRMLSMESLKEMQTGAWLDLASQMDRLGYRHADTLYLRAQALATAAYDREAFEQFEDALKENPSHMQALNDLAWLLLTTDDAAMQDCERALHLAERALAAGGAEEAYVLDTYAEALFQSGRIAEAVEMESKALERARSEYWRIGITGQYKKQLQRFREELTTDQKRNDPGVDDNLG